MNCQATRPERPPRVTDHSTASARSPRRQIGSPKARGIAFDHGEERVLVAIVKADPQAEPVRQRDLLLGRLGRVDGGRALVLDHVARHQVAAVGGGVEQHVLRPALDAAVEHRFQRLVVGVLALERQVVAEDQAAPRSRRAAGAAGRAGWRCPRGGFRSAPGCPGGRRWRRRGRPSPARTCPCRARPTAWRCWPAGRGRSAACSPAGWPSAARCPAAGRYRRARCAPPAPAGRRQRGAWRGARRNRRRRRDPARRGGGGARRSSASAMRVAASMQAAGVHRAIDFREA